MNPVSRARDAGTGLFRGVWGSMLVCVTALMSTHSSPWLRYHNPSIVSGIPGLVHHVWEKTRGNGCVSQPRGLSVRKFDATTSLYPRLCPIEPTLPRR
ncbi:hypothetical protein BGZ61DRAFT_461092 [Ilyonectria robusta]|uniref:uncharacterized protein n=1 Tax=Ilyonectria robusta TaxID=1079257 RepID=UPI001E8EEC12|nr:uncharacterized protein BGZ61DRAFT_461092 [Ilyonectria robusta]KAH8667732.1 hypothetical protein BGZ61DRAFT_461092 [Ilyonectria robusta]